MESDFIHVIPDLFRGRRSGNESVYRKLEQYIKNSRRRNDT